MFRLSIKKRLLFMAVAVLTVAVLFPAGAWANFSGYQPRFSQNPQKYLPDPVLLWQRPMTYAVTDLAVGDLNGDKKADVAAIDWSGGPPLPTPTTLDVLYGEDGSTYFSDNYFGLSVAIGDIDDDDKNEVVAHHLGVGIVAYDPEVYAVSHTYKWQYPTLGLVKDIEIGDVDADGVNEVVACNNETTPGTVYVIDGITGSPLSGWPQVVQGEAFMDIALGQLDDQDGVDVAAIGDGPFGSLYVYRSSGWLMWPPAPIQGRTVEIGDVNGDDLNEVVAGIGRTLLGENVGLPRFGVKVFEGSTGVEICRFNTPAPVADVELGELDGNLEDGKEIACIDNGAEATLYALAMNTEDVPPTLRTMWTYPMSWDTDYFGESIAIGDVDRDYKNEVLAISSVVAHGVYAFDGIDSNNDGTGDLVFSPYMVPGTPNLKLTDLEIGDVDGDGDQDVVVSTNQYYDTIEGGVGVDGSSGEILALACPENKTETATDNGVAYFDADPSQLAKLLPVSEDDLPSAGKPDFRYPDGFFSFEIQVLSPGQTAIVTVTLPNNAPVGTKWVKYNEDTLQWSIIPIIGDDDGDNVITFELTAPEGEYQIYDPGGPGFPRVKGVGGEVSVVGKLPFVLPWLGLAVLAAAGGIFLVLRSRRSN